MLIQPVYVHHFAKINPQGLGLCFPLTAVKEQQENRKAFILACSPVSKLFCYDYASLFLAFFVRGCALQLGKQDIEEHIIVIMVSVRLGCWQKPSVERCFVFCVMDRVFVVFQIVFEGIRGSSYFGDIAIDDVKVTTGSCPSCKKTLWLSGWFLNRTLLPILLPPLCFIFYIFWGLGRWCFRFLFCMKDLF